LSNYGRETFAVYFETTKTVKVLPIETNYICSIYFAYYTIYIGQFILMKVERFSIEAEGKPQRKNI